MLDRCDLGDDGVAVVPLATGDVEIVAAERASATFGGHYRTMTLTGGFGLAALRAAVSAELDHEPFLLVRRVHRA